MHRKENQGVLLTLVVNQGEEKKKNLKSKVTFYTGIENMQNCHWDYWFPWQEGTVRVNGRMEDCVYYSLINKLILNLFIC